MTPWQPAQPVAGYRTGHRAAAAGMPPLPAASRVQVSLWWDDTPVQLATWSPAHQGPPWWLALADGAHLTVHIEHLDEPATPTRWRPARLAVLALVLSLLAHAATLAAMCMSLPRLAPDTPDEEPGQDVSWWVSVPPPRPAHTDDDEELPHILFATHATSLEPSPQPVCPSDRTIEALSTGHLGLERGAEPRPAMATDRAVRERPGVPDVARVIEVDPGWRLRGAFWHHVVRGETLSSIAARYGYDSHIYLYNDRLNPELLRRRPDPNRIFPGDRVRLPRER